MSRYVWRVVVDGLPVRHFQSKRAALHRASEISLRSGMQGSLVTVEQSIPFGFIRDDGSVTVSAAFRRGRSVRWW